MKAYTYQTCMYRSGMLFEPCLTTHLTKSVKQQGVKEKKIKSYISKTYTQPKDEF